MAYTEPEDLLPGERIFLERWNEQVVENIKALKALIQPWPTGLISPCATAVAPPGWMLCTGQAVSRTAYSSLFEIIGTTYGAGDGSTTFNLPDLRGRMPLGKDNMGGSAKGLIADAAGSILGGTGGEESHILSLDEMPSHTHSVFFASYTSYAPTPNTGARLQQVVNTGSQGAYEPHDNMNPYITLSFMIKA